MSGASSSAAAWSTWLKPVRRPEVLVPRADDPRLAEVADFWEGDPAAIKPGRVVLLGFPQDEGVRRNDGRVGAAEAPDAIRHWLYRLTWDGTGEPPLDLGNLHCVGTLEDSQVALGEVIAALLERGTVPIVLGGGHETALGHYLGYASAQRQAGIINLDAHLDVRTLIDGRGHSGSPFRQAMEHRAWPLPGDRYVCLGVQPHVTSRQHYEYAIEHGCVVRRADELAPSLAHHGTAEAGRLAAGGDVMLSVDADVVHMAEVPGVSAPNPVGLPGAAVIDAVRAAAPRVSSFELVEINPRFDRDGQSARWAAVVVWNFLTSRASHLGWSSSTQ